VISGCLVDNDNGAVFYLDNSQVTLTDVELRGNGVYPPSFPNQKGCGGVAYVSGDESSFEATSSKFTNNAAPMGGVFCLANVTKCSPTSSPRIKVTNSTWKYEFSLEDMGYRGPLAYFDHVPLPDCISQISFLNVSSNTLTNVSRYYGSEPYFLEMFNETSFPKFSYSPDAPIQFTGMLVIRDYFYAKIVYRDCQDYRICSEGHGVAVTGGPFHCGYWELGRVPFNLTIPAETPPGFYGLFFGTGDMYCKNAMGPVLTDPGLATGFEILATPSYHVPSPPTPVAPPPLVGSGSNPTPAVTPSSGGLDTPIIVVICVAVGVVVVVLVAIIAYFIRKRVIASKEEQMPLVQ